ncbi:MAG: sodium:proline symporter [Pseudomonadota bacterium]
MQTLVLLALFTVIVVASFLAAPRRINVDGFFSGQSAEGAAPGLWTLTLSQVTTWIFARSLMNAAILGYFFGIAGTLAYAAYYGSFLTGGFIVARLRRDGAASVQDWLEARYGRTGTGCYNVVVGLRLLSEVFANLLVVGLIFDAVADGSGAYAIVAVALLALIYSVWGGLSAALRTDVVQMVLFLFAFGFAFIALISSPGFSLAGVLTAEGVAGSYNGWILLAVAALQVFSYPAHDPVMMDRGFLADPETTRKSFLHAFWISMLCIVAFGFFGIQASLIGAAYQTELIGTWAAMFPPWVFVLLMLSLLVSALSTLDSALASSARLAVEEFGLLARSLTGGRVAMILVMTIGAALTLWGNATLFDAVAVSGTASMFLAPVLIVGLVLQRDVAIWAYVAAYTAAMLGAFAYFARDWPVVAALLPDGHKYEQLLLICAVVLATGFAAVLAGVKKG